MLKQPDGHCGRSDKIGPAFFIARDDLAGSEVRCCKTCGETKRLEGFKKSGSASKPGTMCKACDAARARAWHAEHGSERNARTREARAADPDLFRERARRSRMRNLEAARERGRAYAASAPGRAGNAAAVTKYKKAFPERDRARRLLRKAIQRGIIVRPRMCQALGCRCPKIFAHHHDYAKPLNVVFLCRECHERCHHQAPVRLKNSARRKFARAPKDESTPRRPRKENRAAPSLHA